MTALVCSSYCKVLGASSPARCTAFSVEEGSCKLFTYASTVDQATKDTVYVRFEIQ